ncbi:MAG: molybdate ABC transporter permease subunit [Candidatus Omnitrophica bacterium]|nr:molybdate ABC transporter permease subunit [Candidatus Omnitrophota bacterium]
MALDWGPLLISLRLAVVTTLILLVIGLPLAYGLAFSKRRWNFLLESMVSLPLVLPPTVLGFYLLLLFSSQSFMGHFLEKYFGVKVVFSFTGLVVGSVLFSLPFMVNPVKAAFQSFPARLLEASYALGRSKRETFFQVLLPNVRPAVLSGIVMSFAHTLGEFGVVLMLGGNIPGETRVASLAIYSEVENLNYGQAHMYAGVLVCVSMLILGVFYFLNRRAVQIF